MAILWALPQQLQLSSGCTPPHPTPPHPTPFHHAPQDRSLEQLGRNVTWSLRDAGGWGVGEGHVYA